MLKPGWRLVADDDCKGVRAPPRDDMIERISNDDWCSFFLLQEDHDVPSQVATWEYGDTCDSLTEACEKMPTPKGCALQ